MDVAVTADPDLHRDGDDTLVAQEVRNGASYPEGLPPDNKFQKAVTAWRSACGLGHDGLY
jgi:hypothetical protein